MRIPCCCCAKLAARGFTTEYRDQLASVGLPTLWAGRCLLLQVIVLGHGSLDLEILAASRALEFIDGHQSTSLRGPPKRGATAPIIGRDMALRISADSGGGSPRLGREHQRGVPRLADDPID